jgi:hypothetical protein
MNIINKERYEKNKEERLITQKEYYNKNKEEIIKKSKEMIICNCGKEIQKVSISRHQKSKQHLNFINLN